MLGDAQKIMMVKRKNMSPVTTIASGEFCDCSPRPNSSLPMTTLNAETITSIESRDEAMGKSLRKSYKVIGRLETIEKSCWHFHG
jgi:hypothetical protein